MGKNVLSIMAGLTMASAIFMSCTDYTIMDDNVIRMGLFGEEYSENFQKAYGAINPKQTWDFSLMGLRSKHLEGGPTAVVGNNAATRATDDCNGPIFGAAKGYLSDIKKSVTGAGDYTVQQTTLNWMNTLLNEKHDHRDLGAPFKLVKQAGHDFLIIPIYQGHSNQECDLHLVAKNTSGELKDYMIWTKSQDIKYTQDFTRSGGEEYFYPASGAYGSNRTYDDSGNKYRYLNLGAAYAGILNSVQSWKTFKVHITVPAGGKITGAFGDVSDNNKDNFSDFTVDNTSGSAPKTQTIDLSSCFGDKIQNNGTFTNFGIKKVTLTDCVFNTYEEDKRVHVSLELNDNSSNSQLTQNINISDKVKYADGHTDNRYDVRSTPIRINCANIQEDFFFYLDMTYGEAPNEENQFSHTGTKQRSDEGMMLALMDRETSAKFFDSTGLENLNTQLAPWLSDETGSNWEYFLIGAEDANLKSSDWDMNDVVFLIAAKTAPKIKELVKKRYMIEDLGSTYDFDFNDIVLDVTQETLTNVGTGDKTVTSKASLAHLCGTIPFKIEIGDNEKGYKVLGEGNGANGKFPGQNGNSEIGGLGFDPTTSSTYDELMNVDVTGYWDPEKNNIKVTVWPKENTASWNNNQSSEGLAANAPNGMTYHFPADGKTPFMIAVDQTVGWTHESMTIPHEWFNTWSWTTEFDPDNNLQGGIVEKVDDNIHPIKWFTPVSYVISNDVFCTMTADDMAQISEGDDIVIYYESAAGSANLTVVSGDMNYTQQHSSTLNQAKGSITINVTSTNIDALKRGIAIMGNGYTLTQVKHKRIINVDWGKVNGDNGFVYDSELLSYAKISSNKLTNVKVGDRLTFSIKDVKGAAKVQLQAMGGTNSWKAIEELGGEQTLEGKTNFTLTVTDSNIGYVKNGLAIQGYNFTLTRIQREGSIDFNEEANFVMSASGYDNQITISGTSVVSAGVAVNDDIIITLKDVNGSKRSAQVQHTNPWGNISGYSSDWNNSKITFKVTDVDMLTKLQSGGFAIQGYGYTVVKVTKVTPAIVANITLGQACSFTATKWEDYGQISTGQFSNAVAGDKLVITLSDVQSSAVIAIKSSWNPIDSNHDFYGLTAGATSFELELTDDYATKLRNSGAVIQGVGFTVTMVQLVKANMNLDLNSLDLIWGASYDSGSKTITFNKQYDGRGWNFSSVIDNTKYSEVVVKFEKTPSVDVNVRVNYNDGETSTFSESGYRKEAELKCTIDNDSSKGGIKSIVIQNGTYDESNPPSVILSEAYLVPIQ